MTRGKRTSKVLNMEALATIEHLKEEITQIKARLSITEEGVVMGSTANTDSTMPDLKVVIKQEIDVRLKDLESRVFEIENFRNPSAIESRIKGMGETIESLETQVNRLNSELKRIMDIMQKSFNLTDVNQKHADKAQPKVPAAVS